jgi:hypothetical protein
MAQGGIAVGVELLEQPNGDEQGGGLIAVELEGGEPGALAKPVAAVDGDDVEADVVAELADVALGGADVDLEGLGELGGGEAHPGVAQAVEEVDYPDELVAGRVAGFGGHGARSLPLPGQHWGAAPRAAGRATGKCRPLPSTSGENPEWRVSKEGWQRDEASEAYGPAPGRVRCPGGSPRAVSVAWGTAASGYSSWASWRLRGRTAAWPCASLR